MAALFGCLTMFGLLTAADVDAGEDFAVLPAVFSAGVADAAGFSGSVDFAGSAGVAGSVGFRGSVDFAG